MGFGGVKPRSRNNSPHRQVVVVIGGGCEPVRAPKFLLYFDTRRMRAQCCLCSQRPRATASAGDGLPAYCAAGRFPVEIAESSWISVSSK